MKTSSVMDFTLLASAIGCGLMAGFFFAFSVCVMKALGAIPPAHGISAMQSINVVVINPWFLTPFYGMAALSVVLAISAAIHWEEPGAAYVVGGSVLYVLGTFLVTMLFNVPRNNALAAVDANSTAGAELWKEYLITWTRWNHVRTIAALAGAASFTVALTR